ncbi:hypothetical protein [Saccharopolyspora taberi]|uniref:Minor tail protein n=1 Tax=Saccharopolyspora taberi TaxID=60895 RepID=A0ABN3VKK2_9PSEU
MADEWRVLVAQTTTGEIVGDIRASDVPKFERRISDPGSYTVDVYLGNGANTAADLHEFTETGRYSWIVAYGDYICQAGPVWTWQFSDQERKLSVSGSNVSSLFDKRILRNPHGHTAITDPSEDLILRDLSVRGLLAELVRANLAQRGYQLPITIPEAEPGPESITYYGYDLATVWDRMTDLAERDNGSEVDFAPEFVDGGRQIRWRLDIGDPLLGDQNTGAVWDYGSVIGPIDTDVDGATTPASRVWVKGAGEGRNLLTGVAEDPALPAAGVPGIDLVDTSHAAEQRQDLLDSYARAALQGQRQPNSRWETTLRIATGATSTEASAALGTWALGDAPLIAVAGHPWMPSAHYRRRVVSFADSSPNEIRIDLQPAP